MASLLARREQVGLEQSKPGEFTLVREGIMNEGEAERLARGTSGDWPKEVKKKGVVPLATDPAPI